MNQFMSKSHFIKYISEKTGIGKYSKAMKVSWDKHNNRIEKNRLIEQPSRVVLLNRKIGKIYLDSETERIYKVKANSRYSAWGDSRIKKIEIGTVNNILSIYRPKMDIVDTGNKGYIGRRSTLQHHLEICSSGLIVGRKLYVYFANQKTLCVTLPRGYHWAIDDSGYIYLQDNKKTLDFHPTVSDLQNKKIGDLIRIAKENKRKRLVAKALKSKKEKLLPTIWVSIADSINAGNCNSATQGMLRIIKSKLGAVGEIGAVRADFLVSLRNDSYVQRAIKIAAYRQIG